jgi:hypothetical protein
MFGGRVVTTIGRATVKAGEKGVDFSFAKPPGDRLLELGYTFVVGYISVPPSNPAKNISKAQCEAYIAAGLKVLLVWEQTATTPNQGALVGTSNGRDAKLLAEARGYPTDVPILTAVDTNTVILNIAAQEAYVRAFAVACAPYPIGIYGDTDILSRCQGLWRIGWVPNAWSWSGSSRLNTEAKARALGAHVLQRTGYHIDNSWAVDPNEAIADFPAWGKVPPPIGEPVTPYVFKLADGSIGIRHESGARHVNSGELEGPLTGERVWPVPALSAWEAWIKRELAQYERELDAPTPAPPGGPLPVSGFVGTIALTATE